MGDGKDQKTVTGEIMKFSLDQLGYVLDSQTGIWSRTGYRGIAYSDGHEVEQRIFAAIADAQDVTVLSAELSRQCTDWPFLYHLSGTRANILRPFQDILKGADVLEVGAGCGAITRYLGECEADVVALEGSPRRAAITRLRTRDLPNVVVVSDRLDDFKGNHQFDVMTLIGVLEYANLFVSGSNPALAMLQQARAMLKPNGRLIIAIENQLGLKYFAGAPEDHVSQPMYGIEGRYEKDQPQTYGRKTLSEMLSQAGFACSEFMAPFPDYKLPVSIVTEKGFSCDDFDAAALAWQSVKRDPQLPSLPAFSQERVWPILVRNRVALDLANSFLVVAGVSEGQRSDLPILAWHFTSERSREFCKETRFLQTEMGSVEVQYRTLLPDRSKHVQGRLLTFSIPDIAEYRSGRLLSEDLIDIVTRDGWRMEEVGAFLKRYLNGLGRLGSSGDISQSIDSPHNRLSGDYFDLLPHNIIVGDDGIWRVIDQEWTFKKDISVGWLIFRALYVIIGMVTRFGVSAGEAVKTPLGFIHAAFQTLGFSITADEMNAYVKLELNVQEEIARCPFKNDRFLDWLRKPSLPQETLHQAVVHRDGQIIGFNQALHDKDIHINNLEGQIAVLKKAVDDRDRQIANLGESLTSMRTSTSWKITSPMRWFVYKINNLYEIIYKTFIYLLVKTRRHHLTATSRLISKLLSGTAKIGGRHEFTEHFHAAKVLNRQEMDSYQERMAEFTYRPMISILVPVYNVDPAWLSRCIRSVQNQIYPHWELCLCDDYSDRILTVYTLITFEEQDKRIKLVLNRKNCGIASASNAALETAEGEFVAFLDHDDELTPDALFEVVKTLNEDPAIDILYSDQDKIDADDQRREPFFKPDWSPEYFNGVMYVGHLLVARLNLVRKASGFNSEFDGVQDYELMLRMSELTKNIAHIPKILYHWRILPGSIAAHPEAKRKMIDIEKLQRNAVSAHLRRTQIPADVQSHPDIPHRVMIHPQPRLDFPLVSIIIPNRTGSEESLRRCLGSLFAKTTYRNFEVIIVDENASIEEVRTMAGHYPVKEIVSFPGPFQLSAFSNLGVKHAGGDFLIFLNSATEVSTPSWMEILLFHMELPDVGVVGPLLICPDGTVRHAGIVLSASGAICHAMRGFPNHSDGYAGSLSCTREVSAVAGACMMTRRDLFMKAGGFVEYYDVQDQDVDLCLRIREMGKRILITPRCVLLSHERVDDASVGNFLDRALLLDTWGKRIEKGDPYYNPNFSRDSCDYRFDGAS